MTTVLIAVACIVFAWVQANTHADLIRLGNMTAKVKEDWTLMRAVALSAACLAGYAFGPLSLFEAILLFCAGWCAVTTLFRRALNDEMGWDINYLGATSRYDLAMISLVMFLDDWRWPSAMAIKETHDKSYQASGAYRRTVHEAGRLATKIEVVIAAACTLMSLL